MCTPKLTIFSLLLTILAVLTHKAPAEEKNPQPFLSIGKNVRLICDPRKVEANSRSLKACGVKELTVELVLIRDGKMSTPSKWELESEDLKDKEMIAEGQILLLHQQKGEKEDEIVASLGAALEGARPKKRLLGGTAGYKPGELAVVSAIGSGSLSSHKNHIIFKQASVDLKAAKTLADFDKATTLDELKTASARHKEAIVVVVTLTWKP
jgi:hypothetical protein